jgi:hypothetical protein
LKKLNHSLNGGIGFVIGKLQLSFRLTAGVGAVMEEAVGQRAAEALMKE